MRRVGLIVFLLLLCVPGALLAQQPGPQAPKISVSVNPQPLIQGEPFTLEFTIETQGEGEPDIQLPRFGGLQVLRRFESHPSSFSFSFGFGGGATQIRKEQAVYSFVLVADKPGMYTLDPVIVTVNKQRFKGKTYKLEVLKGTGGASGGGGSLTPAAPDPNAPADDMQQPSNTDTVVENLDGAKVDSNFFVQTAVSKKEAVVGEMLTMTIYLYMARNISNYDIIREPGTEGFWGENLIPSTRRTLSTETVTVNGRPYDRAVLRQLALFPIKPGTLTISPTVVEVETSPGIFFSRRKAVKRSSLPVQIKVSDLPADNQPAGFNPANVGKYAFAASIDNAEVKVGEPVTLTLTVSGEGNLRNLVLPEVPEIDGLKIYAPEIETDITPRGLSVAGTRTSRVLMIPKKSGEFQLPKLDWSFFDPEAGAYETLHTPMIPVHVRGVEDSVSTAAGAAPSVETVSKVGQDRLNRRLRSIVSRADLRKKSDGHPLTRPWFLALVFGVPLLYLGVWISSRTRRKLAAAKLKNRSKNADAEALRQLHDLRKKAHTLSPEAFFGDLQRCLLVFIEMRLEEKVVGDTMAELRERLTERGFTADQAERVIAESESCDFARFARQGTGNDDRERVAAEIEKLIRELAKVPLTPLKKEKR